MSFFSSVHNRLLIFSLCLLFLTATCFTLGTLPYLKKEAAPLLETKARAVGDAISGTIEKLLSDGVPLNRFVGMREYLDEFREQNQDIEYLAVQDALGKTLYTSGDTAPSTKNAVFATDIQRDGKLQATILVGQNRAFVEERLRDVMLDAFTVLLISAIIAFELLLFINATLVVSPLGALENVLEKAAGGDFSHRVSPRGQAGEVRALGKWINAQLEAINQRYNAWFSQLPKGSELPSHFSNYVFSHGQPKIETGNQLAMFRWPFFMLVFAEGLSVSFLPRFVASMPLPDLGIPKDILIGSPISLFMLTWAIALPFAGAWSDRVGRKRSLATGAGLTAIGLLSCTLANELLIFLACRLLTAIGYALVFVSAQSYVTDHCPADKRTQGMAMFLSSFFGGSLSGAAIGGILADRLGWQITFALSAFLALGVTFFVLRFLPGGQPSENKKAGWKEFRAVFGNGPIMALTVLAAIPAKISLTGLLYFATPLYLLQVGASQSLSGRVMMGYGLSIIILAPIFSRFADRWRKKPSFVVGGGVIAGAGLLICPLLPPGWETALIGVAVIGIGFAISGAPQLAMVTEFAQARGNVSPSMANGVFRLIERVGSALGPIIAGMLLATYGFKGVFTGIGALNLLGALALSIVFLIVRKKS